MKVDLDRLSDKLASDRSVTDYDFWRALRTVNHELFALDRTNAPIPMQVIHLRAVLRKARAKRRARKEGR